MKKFDGWSSRVNLRLGAFGGHIRFIIYLGGTQQKMEKYLASGQINIDP